jgi:membrane carboxypeptidase/penicillin-binding protein
MENLIISPKNFKRRNFKFKLNWNWKKLGKIAGYVFGAGFLFVAGVFIYFAKDLPSPGNIGNRVITESTKIYDRTGTHILYDVHGEEKRTVIPFASMPDSIKF